ncbi:hypothetical protein BDZ45DRAFT_802610 [Acephala macrosclerotiorum]|nr:hypothetical protein BDZ45DRAFT_802610 [Acephala macrosclerotiorum]
MQGPALQDDPRNSLDDLEWSMASSFLINVNSTFPVGLFDLDCPSYSRINPSELQAFLDSAGSVYANKTNRLTKQSSGIFLDIDARVEKGNEGTQSLLFGALSDSQTVIWSCKVRLSTRNATIGCFDGRSDYSLNLTEVGLVAFSMRLTTAFNTFGNDTSYDLYPTIYSTSTTPTCLLPLPIIKCNWIYFSILTITSIPLILASLACIWLRYQISTPDVLGYVSSLARANPYTPLLESTGSGSALDGLKWTALSKDLRFRLGDVQGKEEFGKVAFALAGDSVVKCVEGRKYA